MAGINTTPFLKKKLWIGNLDKRITEYNLLKIVQRYGEVENFQYLFHTVGPNKGEPRSYCFVEYKKKEDAEHALQKLNGKMVLSEVLQVRWAEDMTESKEEKLPRYMKGGAPKMTSKVLSRDEKIKAIEGKLKMMERADERNSKPFVFRGKHPLLARSDQRKDISKAVRQKQRHPYSSSKNRSSR